MSNSSALVSVIVPNYNHAPFLKRRLDSILNQTYKSFEIIILDDCSSDNSKEIIEEYRNRPQVSHVVYNETNSGSPFKQWAKGFDLAQGKYIWIAESDDWADLNFLSTLVPKLNNKNTIVAFSNSTIVYPTKTENNQAFPDSTLFNGLVFLKKHMVYGNSIPNASSAVFKKECLNKIPTTYKSFKSSGDWLFWIELCLFGNIYFSAKPLNFNNRHGNNVTAVWSKTKADGTAPLEDFYIYSYLKKKHLLSIYQTCSIIAIKRRWIDANKNNFISRDVYKKLKKTWGSNVAKAILSKCIERSGFYIWKITKLFV